MATVTKSAGSNDGVWVTTVSPNQNQTITSFHYNFDFAIPAGSGIDQIQANVEFHVSTQASIATFGLQLWHNGVAAGTEVTDTSEPLVALLKTKTLTTSTTVDGWSVTELNKNTTSGWEVRIRATRGNSLTAVTFTLDSLAVTVTYTAPPEAQTETETPPIDAVGTSALVSVTGGHLTDVVEASGTAELAIIFDTGAALGSAELLSYVDITKALFDDGSDGGFTDYTTAANEDTANDVLMIQDHAFDHDEDSFYFLMGTYGTPAFYGLYMNITQAGTGNFVLAWEYYNGVAWVSLDSYILTFTGAIPNLKTAGINKIDISPPADISDVLKNGFLAKWIRVRWVSGNNGQEVKAGRIKVLAAGDYTIPPPTFSFPIISANGLIHDMIHRIVRG